MAWDPNEEEIRAGVYINLDDEDGEGGGGGEGGGVPGPPGPPGPAGYTPVKGVDYFDGAPGAPGPAGYTPIKGVDYFDGLPGPRGEPGQKGDPGAPGAPGYSPMKNIDYFDGAQGPAGYTPQKGVDYFDGAPGAQGPPGPAPVKGVDYFDGVQGPRGDPGPPGYTPIKGVDYFDGATGPQGPPGPAGSGEGGSSYTHPATHPASMITTDASRRFTSDTEINSKAPLASPTLTGTPTAPTASSSTNTTQIATTAFVTAAITAKTTITGNAGTATKLETARTINGVSFDGTANITIVDSTKAPTASPTLTGTPTAPTAATGTNTTQLATTAFVTSAISDKTTITGNAGTATKLATARTINGVSFDGSANITIVDSTKAPTASPALTGTPTAPTAATGTNTTQLATTAFVQGAQSAHLNDYLPHDSGLSQYSSSVDGNGFYRVVDYRRPDATLYLKSTASNPNAAGRYQTITWQFYAANGTTVALTKTWTLTYDANGVIVSKVLA